MAEELGMTQTLIDELADERRKREGLEQKVNELLAETARSRAVAEEAERGVSIRAELQKLGVAKIDLAYRAVRDDLKKSGGDEMREYLSKFVTENPELMPARMAGGSGASPGQRSGAGGGGFDLDKIRPGMSAEDMERVRQEIARVASQALRGGF
jgi:galactokinase/mevalonate kinase-like predicted kinase